MGFGIGMDVEGVKAYKLVYEAVVKRIGPEMTIAITAHNLDSVDEAKPQKTLTQFLVPINAMFGDTTLRRLVYEALLKGFSEIDSREMLVTIFKNLEKPSD